GHRGGLLGPRPAEVLRGAEDGPGRRAVRLGGHPAVVRGGAGGGRTGEATGVVAGGVRGVAAAAAAREVGTVAEVVWGEAGEASSGAIAEEPSGRGGRLCPESVGGAPALHDGGLPGDRQQRGGAGLACGRNRPQELPVFWERRRR